METFVYTVSGRRGVSFGAAFPRDLTTYMPTLILLTATIVPPNDAGVVFDPKTRLGQYRSALEFYFDLMRRDEYFGYLVFAENSMAHLGELEALVTPDLKGRVEFLQYQGLDYPTSYGYGYGEFKLLDFAMSNSSLIDKLPLSSQIMKITGRYKVLNLKSLATLSSRDVCVDVRNRRSPWLDMRVMFWNRLGYSEFFQMAYENLRIDVHRLPPEMTLPRLIDRKVTALQVSTYYAVEPEISGVRGFDGRDWNTGMLRVKYWIRRVERAVRSFRFNLRAS